MTKPTLTIAIPALNEETNIGQLVSSLLRQKITLATLEKIVVVSDGSTDATVPIVRALALANPKVVLVHHTSRTGKAVRQNEIFAAVNSNISVLVDADISISDPTFIDQVIAPVVAKSADLTSASIQTLPPRTFFESVLGVSMQLKKILFSQFRGGQNAYTCFGPARAFSQRLYHRIVFDPRDGDDVFSYLFCVSKGFKFQSCPQAVAHYRLPDKFSDHLKQSLRYIGSQRHMSEVFDDRLVKKELMIPLPTYIKSAFYAFPVLLRFPIQSVCYLFIYTRVRWKLLLAKGLPVELWQVSSSKKV